MRLKLVTSEDLNEILDTLEEIDQTPEFVQAVLNQAARKKGEVPVVSA